MKTLEVINTGTELLLGNVVNRHLSWLGKALFGMGLRINRQTTVPDGVEIRNALLESIERKTEILLVTGGLGPTTDDVTREVASGLFGLALEKNAEVLRSIQERCARRGIVFRERMGRQAFVPHGGIVLPNANGTAPGIYLPAAETSGEHRPHLFLLPGPPRELYPMFEDHVRPLLQKIAPPDTPGEMRVYRVSGMGESAVEELIGKTIEDSGDLEVGYCARPNEVDFRLIGAPEILNRWHDRVLEVLGENFVCLGEKPLEEVIVELLLQQKKTIATAESCTGGFLAHRLTNVPGVSASFLEGAVTYSNSSKHNLLGVPTKLIETVGAVSAEVAKHMAEGIRRHCDSDFALSTTGIAGPGGGTPEKPVGTVFIGLAARSQEPVAFEFHFPSDRESFKLRTSQTALDLLRRHLQKLFC